MSNTMRVLYLEVTQDAYQLPMAVAESARELALMTGVKPNMVSSSASRAVSRKSKCPRFIKITLDEEDDRNNNI